MTTAVKQRNIINISLPPALAREVRAEVKKEGFASVSEYFRHLIREHRKTQLAEELRIEREEFAAGRGVVLTSLKTLRS
ncbi:MAG: ribbon-helix-helix protein, CopG family [Candidatus Pacebacteria bacterium]|nr:ribbon-helix-helix protein, CopG family [Candidatus Paceibacterota bacterium]